MSQNGSKNGQGPSLEQVLELVSWGFKVHPLHVKDKIPCLGRWQERASDDEATIRNWYAGYPNANWGILTGEPSGIFVIDLDPKESGEQSWEFLADENGVPETVEVKTGSGGRHIYFKYPAKKEIRNSASKIGRGIDVRGTGGNIVAAHSVHPNGTEYSWIKSPADVKIAKAPKWLLDLITDESIVEYASLGGPIEKGTRNNSIFHQSLALARQGSPIELTMKVMAAWLVEQGREVDDEVKKTVESAYKKAIEQPIKLEHRSDSLNAELFIQAYGSDLVYITGLGWHHWDGKRWAPEIDSTSNGAVIQLFIKTMNSLRDNAVNQLAVAKTKDDVKDTLKAVQWAVESTNIGKIEAALKIAKTIAGVAKSQAAIDGPETIWLLNCRNGIIDLRTGDLLPHDKTLMITKLVNIDYNPTASAPFWESTILLSQNGNEEMAEYIQRALGYSITGSGDERCFFLAWGEEGNNGKSTILETVQEILGDYAQMSDPVIITSDTDNRVASSLAKLPGARMVNMNETEEGKKLSEAFIKAITGGDTVQACKKFMEPFEFRPVMKLWLRTNNKPVIRGYSSSIWNRVKMVPFEHEIPAEKRLPRSEVDERLRTEHCGILAWLVQGELAWRKDQPLKLPEIAQRASADYRTEQDVVQIFWDECTENKADAKLGSSTAYKAFYNWCRDSGEKWIMPRRKFTDHVVKKILEKAQYGRGTGGETTFLNKRLNALGQHYEMT